MVGARVRRQQVAYAEGRGLSRRPACALLSVARSTVGYVSTLIARDAAVVPPMHALAAQYPRYGYRTIRIFLERQGHALGTDRMYRLVAFVIAAAIAGLGGALLANQNGLAGPNLRARSLGSASTSSPTRPSTMSCWPS